MTGRKLSTTLGLLGGLIGGGIGVVGFDWIVGQGFYAIMLPGAFVGLGCGLLSWHDSTAKGIGCAAIALGASLLAEWRAFPFVKDRSFSYFLGHLHDLRPITMILIGVGVGLAFYIGRGHLREAGKPAREAS